MLARERPLLRRVIQRATPVALFLTFAVLSAHKLSVWLPSGHLGVDLRIYREAAATALSGGDPWTVRVDGYLFAAPPPSLIPYIPAALLPEDVATVVYAAVFVAAAVLTTRALGLPVWWILFPPLFEAVLALNPDALLVLLLVSGPVAGGAATSLKVYAAIPLVLQRRWKALLLAVAFAAVSIPWWPGYIAGREAVQASLESQAGSLSAWGTLLMLPALVALFVLRRRGAEWLVVPALWPFTQLHYAAIAMPAAKRSPLLAFLLSFGIPLLPALAVIVEGLRVLIQDEVSRRSEASGGSRGVATADRPAAT